MDELSLYSVIGEEGFARLVAAFYRRVPEDEILGPMYPAADLEEAERHLRDFLIYRFGGPPRYVSDRGHPRLRARHFQFAIPQTARDRWMMLMNDALGNAGIPVEAQQILRTFLDPMSTFMINQDGRGARHQA